MSRGAWEATVNEGKELDTTEHTHNTTYKLYNVLLVTAVQQRESAI